MTNTEITYLVAACCLVFGLAAFIGLVVAPAMTAYRTFWERGIALILSIYVLAALVAIGLVVGVVVITQWPTWFGN